MNVKQTFKYENSSWAFHLQETSQLITMIVFTETSVPSIGEKKRKPKEIISSLIKSKVSIFHTPIPIYTQTKFKIKFHS